MVKNCFRTRRLSGRLALAWLALPELRIFQDSLSHLPAYVVDCHGVGTGWTSGA